MNKLSRYLQPALIVLWGMVCFTLLQTTAKYLLYFEEQNQLFLNTADHALTYLGRPAWLALLTGDALTQFYYYTYAGPAIVTLALLVLGDVLRRGLQTLVPRWWAFGAALAVMTLALSCCFSEHYRLSSVIALIGGSTAFWLLMVLDRLTDKPPLLANRWTRALTALIAAAATFWLFGSGLWLFAVLTVVLVVADRRQWLRLVAVAAVVALVPTLKRVCLTSAQQLYATPTLGTPRLPSLAVDRDLAVITEYGLGNHQRVVRLVEAQEQPSRVMKFYYNLVMAERGLLPDNLLRWTDQNLGTFAQISADTPPLVIYTLNDLYWALGDMTYTERAAMLANVFSPHNRNIKMTRRLAEVNLVTGDSAAADKYLRLLQQTWVYNDWATRLLRRDRQALAPYREKVALTNRLDTIQAGQNIHTVMMQLLDSNPRNTVALDYALCSLLLLKDVETFHRDYDRYCMATRQPRTKRLYQEALCIYLAAHDAPQDEWQRYITDMTVLHRFMDYNQQRGSTQFSDTYWYYFDKAPQIKLK